MGKFQRKQAKVQDAEAAKRMSRKNAQNLKYIMNNVIELKQYLRDLDNDMVMLLTL